MHRFENVLRKLDRVMKMEYVPGLYLLSNCEMKGEEYLFLHLTLSFQHLMIVPGVYCSSRQTLCERGINKWKVSSSLFINTLVY